MQGLKARLFKNGYSYEWLNKKVTVYEKDGHYHVEFLNAKTDMPADVPACQHKVLKGRVRYTFVKMTDEAFYLMCRAYFEYKNYKKESSIHAKKKIAK